jgi:hypothetical protein
MGTIGDCLGLLVEHEAFFRVFLGLRLVHARAYARAQHHVRPLCGRGGVCRVLGSREEAQLVHQVCLGRDVRRVAGGPVRLVFMSVGVVFG